MKAETLKRKLDDLEQQSRRARKRTAYVWIDDPDNVPEPPEDADQVIYYQWQTEDAPEPEA
jgi:hypothetical protein